MKICNNTGYYEEWGSRADFFRRGYARRTRWDRSWSRRHSGCNLSGPLCSWAQSGMAGFFTRNLARRSIWTLATNHIPQIWVKLWRTHVASIHISSSQWSACTKVKFRVWALSKKMSQRCQRCGRAENNLKKLTKIVAEITPHVFFQWRSFPRQGVSMTLSALRIIQGLVVWIYPKRASWELTSISSTHILTEVTQPWSRASADSRIFVAFSS